MSKKSEQGALRASLDGTAGHTPGPWHADEIGAILDAKGQFITTGSKYVGGEPYANATLIASAPDLLRENARLREELRVATGMRQVEATAAHHAKDELTRARAAHLENAELLAKARGWLADAAEDLRLASVMLDEKGMERTSAVVFAAGLRALARSRPDAPADRKGNALKAPPLGSDSAAGRVEGKKP